MNKFTLRLNKDKTKILQGILDTHLWYSQLPNTRAGRNKWAGGKGPENSINGQVLINGQLGNCFMIIQFGVTSRCKLETIPTILELLYQKYAKKTLKA